MRQAGMALAAAAALLVACERNADSFSPRIIVQKPSGNAITSVGDITVSGEAIDDRGVQHVYIKGRDKEIDLLDYAEYQDRRGQRLVKFSFKGVAAASGKVGFTIRAVDVNGRETTVELPIQVDGERPTHCLSRVERTEGGVVVAGRASDNVKVVKVFVNGNETNISPGRSVTFYAEVPPRATIDLVVQDGAGNRQYQQYAVPASPRVNTSCAQ